jgi:hypothetical protein
MTRIGDDQLAEMMALIEGSDDVELKLTVPESDQRSAIKALGIDPLDAQIRQVYFFDTPDLALDGAGVVVRGRRVAGKGDDSVVKLRPVVPSTLPEDLRRSAAFKVELDAVPGGFVCSASLKGRPDTGMVKGAGVGEAPLKKLFSKEQRAFYKTHAPEGLGFEHLTVLGPIFVLKLRFEPPELRGRRMDVEMWLYPDDSRILELSTKCLPHEAFQVAAEGRAYLTSKGIDLEGEQSTKTRRALEYFTRVAA